MDWEFYQCRQHKLFVRSCLPSVIAFNIDTDAALPACIYKTDHKDNPYWVVPASGAFIQLLSTFFVSEIITKYRIPPQQ
jgi:hypothetical protein